MHSHPGLNGKLHHYLGPDGEAREEIPAKEADLKFWKSFPDSKGEGLEKNEGPLRRAMTRAQNVALSPGTVAVA